MVENGPVLILQGPDMPSRNIDLAGAGRLTFGRSSDCDIVLGDRAVSRLHSELSCTDGRWNVADLGSTNGTELNGTPIEGPSPLTPGDRIGIGPFTIVFSPTGRTTSAKLAESEAHMTLHSLSLKEFLDQSSPTRRQPKPEKPSEKLSHFLMSMDRVGQALVAHRPLDELLGIVVDLVRDVLQVERAALFLVEKETGELVPHATAQEGEAAEFVISNSIARQAIDSRESIVTSDAMADDRFREQASIANLHIQSALCAPLWNDDEVTGLLYADNRKATIPFNREDLRMITLIAHLAAVKIQETLAQERIANQRRLEEELGYAAGIQQKLLPVDEIDVGRFHIGGRNVPSLEVGGDYFDYFTADDGLMWIALGDVSGKGMSAALLMSNLHATLRAQVEAGLNLDQVAPRLNNAVFRSTQGERFITLFVLTLDPNDGKVEFINAGHNPPMLLRASGEMEELEPGGLITGIFPDTEYEKKTTRIAEGDALLLYSDGVTEGRNDADDEFGEERLAKFLAENRTLSPRVFAKKLIDTVIGFCAGGDPGDDVTVLLVRSD